MSRCFGYREAPAFPSRGWAGELPPPEPWHPPRLPPQGHTAPQPHPAGLIYRAREGATGTHALVFSPGLETPSVTALKPRFPCGCPAGVWALWHSSCSTAWCGAVPAEQMAPAQPARPQPGLATEGSPLPSSQEQGAAPRPPEAPGEGWLRSACSQRRPCSRQLAGSGAGVSSNKSSASPLCCSVFWQRCLSQDRGPPLWGESPRLCPQLMGLLLGGEGEGKAKPAAGGEALTGQPRGGGGWGLWAPGPGQEALRMETGAQHGRGSVGRGRGWSWKRGGSVQRAGRLWRVSCSYSRHRYYSHPLPAPLAAREHNELQENVTAGSCPWPRARCAARVQLAVPRPRCREPERDGGGGGRTRPPG